MLFQNDFAFNKLEKYRELINLCFSSKPRIVNSEQRLTVPSQRVDIVGGLNEMFSTAFASPQTIDIIKVRIKNNFENVRQTPKTHLTLIFFCR